VNHRHLDTSADLGVTLAGVAILLIGLAVQLRTRAKGRRAQLWPTTRGIILSSEVVAVPMAGRAMLTPALTYSYQVAGQALESRGLRIGAPPYFSRPAKARALAAKYPVGSQVTVHYDPAAPTRTALDLSIGEGYAALMIYASGATVVGLGIFSMAMLV
jgi:hypothetical protein